MKPTKKPANPCFSSGPCAKRPGWSLDALKGAALGRSHRAKIGKTKLQQVIEQSREILGIPADYKIGIMPGSDTGAVEMALWSLLGARGVDVLAWESFGKDWITDITKQLKLKDVRTFEAGYGQLPDVKQADCDRDVVFTWNGTTSGVKMPNGDWIKDNRQGLTICDATSAVFAMELPWQKLDVVTWSWQKVLGGEAAHGMLVLSPRAVERLTSYTPSWPMPKIFRMTKKGELAAEIFEGSTINTPSMLAVEDALDGLNWAKSVGGLKELVKRSNTSICLKITDPAFTALDKAGQEAAAKQLASALEKEGAAYDIGAYRDAPAGLRIWGGATVETSDVEALTAWLDWAWAEVKQGLKKAA